jgi:hypothetical protein
MKKYIIILLCAISNVNAMEQQIIDQKSIEAEIFLGFMNKNSIKINNNRTLTFL